jgi:hypothetical protein
MPPRQEEADLEVDPVLEKYTLEIYWYAMV